MSLTLSLDLRPPPTESSVLSPDGTSLHLGKAQASQTRNVCRRAHLPSPVELSTAVPHGPLPLAVRGASPTHLFAFSCMRPTLLTSFTLYIFTAFPLCCPYLFRGSASRRGLVTWLLLSLVRAVPPRSAAGQMRLDQTPVRVTL